eukprot:gene3529-13592_t
MAAKAHSAAPVKNYHLELLTLLAQDAAAARGGPYVADGSMQLVLDVLQSLVDEKMPQRGVAELQTDLSEDQFGVLVSRLKNPGSEPETGPGRKARKDPENPGSEPVTGPGRKARTDPEIPGSEPVTGPGRKARTDPENPGSVPETGPGSKSVPASVTLVYGHPGPGSFGCPYRSNHLADVAGMSVVMEDLALAVPDIPGWSGGQCISLTRQAQLEARGCIFSSPNAPCIGAESGSHCHLIDCCFGPDKERGASAGVIVESSSGLVAERCLFQRCREAAVEVRSAGSRAQLKECNFIKCKKQAVMLYAGGEELVMKNCVIDPCGDMTLHHLLLVACGTARLCKCSFVNNKCDAVVVQCDSQQSAPVLDMRECVLKGNMSGVMFGSGRGVSSSGGIGILVDNQITDNASFGLSIRDVEPNRQIQLIGNNFCGNGPNIGQRKMDVILLKNVHDHVVMKDNRGTIHNPSALVWEMVDAILGPDV